MTISKLKNNIEISTVNMSLEKKIDKIISDTSFNDQEKSWGEYKKEAIEVGNIYKLARKKDPTIISEQGLMNLQNCADVLFFNVDKNDLKKLSKVFFCRNKFCPMCKWRKSLRQFSQVSMITDYIETYHDDVRYIFVTFTQENITTKNLSCTIDKMNEAFKRLVSTSRIVAVAKKFKRSYLGHIRIVEVTYNLQSHTYTLNTHCIFAVKETYFKIDNYLTREDWKKVWQNLMKLDYLPFVKNKVIKKEKQTETVAKLIKALVNNPMPIINFPENEAVQVLIDINKTFHGRRTITNGGIFKEVKSVLNL